MILSEAPLKTGSQPAPLVEVRRGSIVESLHRGHIAAVDGDGRNIAAIGSPNTITFLRSSAKPFQALPLVLSKAVDRFGFTEAELALACGSHCGEPIHVQAAESMLKKVGLDRSALKCGKHEPFNLKAAETLRRQDREPDVLQNNCSGKHIAMLAMALHSGARIETYDLPNNPVQLEIADVIAQFSGIDATQMITGIDGCGAPVFAMPIQAMALMYARLVAPPTEIDEELRDGCARIVNAMTRYPEMVGGTVDRLDTMLMQAAAGSLVSKIGAEGVYTVGVLPSTQWPRGLGLAVKIEDGDDRRARPIVVLEALRQLEILNEADLERFASLRNPGIRNLRGELVGEVRAEFAIRSS